MKKLEPMINTISPIISYLFRGNTDITNLRSGTALKAIILYVLDYITKTSLKTHAIFDVIQNVFQNNAEILGGSASCSEKTRRLMTKMVNSLTARMELGTPMIVMYLLGNPDHYTSHNFVPFYWNKFVTDVKTFWSADYMESKLDKVMLIKKKDRIMGLSNTYDYIY